MIQYMIQIDPTPLRIILLHRVSLRKKMLQINILYIMGQTENVFSESYFLVYSIVALAWIQLFNFQKLVIITRTARNYVGRDYS